MKKWTSPSSLLFLAAVSVYPVQGLLAAAGNGAGGAGAVKNGPADVRLLDETAGPVAAATSQPASGQNVGASQVSVSDAGTVEIHVNEANLVEVLRMLSLQSQKNIIASKSVHGTVTANLYNVTIREALDAILKANGFAYVEKGNFIFVYTAQELAEIKKAEERQVSEVFRVYYTPASNAVNMIKPVLSPDAQVSFTAQAEVGLESKTTGGDTHASDDMIVVKDYPEYLDRARKVLKEIDRRPQQILIEATILAARLTDDTNLGIDFTLLGSVDFGSFIHSAGQIVGAGIGKGDGTTTVDSNSVNSVGSGNQFTKGLNPGFKVGVVTSNVSVFINALEEATNSVVLANPKVLALNKQRGEVLVGREDGYLTTTVTDTTSVQTVQFLQTGTRLTFRPFIGDDGYIRMEVHPEDSDGKVVSGLPSKTTTEVTTNIMVKDGHTIVIGGLFRESSVSSRSQIPGIGSIPLIGPLLGSNKVDNTTREEIIVLLTPHIVKDDQAYSEASVKQMKDFEKLRVGVRQGMMPFGRERLAESSYDCAVAEMGKPAPDRKKALWYLDCATNLNPTFLEAIKMKQDLSGRELMSVDNSVSRDFVRQQIMAERASMPVTTPVEPQGHTAAPATQPAPQAAVVQPTTQPAAQSTPMSESQTAMAVEAPATQPATQPVAEVSPAAQTSEPTPANAANEPAQTPVVEAAEPAEPPADAQPVAETDVPATQPAAQASAQPLEKAAASETHEQKVTLLEESEEAVQPAPADAAAAKQPATGEENATGAAVTELPSDDADGSVRDQK